jgi:hypothetical protein
VPTPPPRLLLTVPARVQRGARRRVLAVEHLHLPHKAAGVERAQIRRVLAVEHLHLPHEAAGVAFRRWAEPTIEAPATWRTKLPAGPDFSIEAVFKTAGLV